MDTGFSTRLRRCREERSLSLALLADASGVSRAAPSKIERAERTPSLVNALQIAEALGVPLAELVGQDQTRISVTRAGNAPRVTDVESGAVREALLQPYAGTEGGRYTLPSGRTVSPFPAHKTGTRGSWWSGAWSPCPSAATVSSCGLAMPPRYPPIASTGSRIHVKTRPSRFC